jgi:hypothetical protein
MENTGGVRTPQSQMFRYLSSSVPFGSICAVPVAENSKSVFWQRTYGGSTGVIFQGALDPEGCVI